VFPVVCSQLYRTSHLTTTLMFTFLCLWSLVSVFLLFFLDIDTIFSRHCLTCDGADRASLRLLTHVASVGFESNRRFSEVWLLAEFVTIYHCFVLVNVAACLWHSTLSHGFGFKCECVSGKTLYSICIHLLYLLSPTHVRIVGSHKSFLSLATPVIPYF